MKIKIVDNQNHSGEKSPQEATPRDGGLEHVDRLLDRLRKVTARGKGWKAECPAHDDADPSLSINVGDDGRVLLKCFAGCRAEDIMGAIRLPMSALFPAKSERYTEEEVVYPPQNRATVQHSSCTLAEYAEAKQLPAEWLQDQGLRDFKYLGRPAVRISYSNSDGTEATVRYRRALHKATSGDGRFCWKKGSKVMLYGLQSLPDVKRAGYVVLAEGESDCHTLWYHLVPALGLPGASNWKEDWAELLADVPIIYVILEGDQGEEAILRWLARSSIRSRTRLVRLVGVKDPSALYLRDPSGFKIAFEKALESSVPWTDLAAQLCEQEHDKAAAQCQELARLPDILSRFGADLARAGVVGEERTGKLLYLGLTSRLLDRPVSMAVKGPSSAGKSFLAERVTSFFPESAYYTLSAVSEKALAYSEEPVDHRFLILLEAAGIAGDFATYLMRSLLSEGCIRYETVEKTPDGLKGRLIEREGPTGLITTTTAVGLHPENETRLLSITVSDTAEQTRAILRSHGRRSGGSPQDAVDLAPWRALQEWLSGAELRVVIPFAESLVSLIPPVATRLRRDVSALISLIQAHAILHQLSRERDADGRIIATLDDYAQVRNLIADILASGVDVTVPKETRQTVQAIERLIQDASAQPHTVSNAELAKDLKLDKGTVSRRVRVAIGRDYVVNEETGRGRPARLVLGEPMPGDKAILPEPGELEDCCTVARISEGYNASPPQRDESAPAAHSTSDDEYETEQW